MKNVLEYIENTIKKYPDKIAFADESGNITFENLYYEAKRIGTGFAKYAKENSLNNEKERGIANRGIVYMEKGIQCMSAIFGLVYGGFTYIPVGCDMPDARIESIIKTSGANAIICNKEDEEKCAKFGISVFTYEEALESEIDDEILREVRDKQKETDLLYIMFTSGSTGVPKGVMITHKGVILYIDSLSECLGSNDKNIYANQAPIYSDASLKEIYQCIKNGSTVYFVPKSLFLFPVKLVEYLNENKINTLCWVSSALSFVSSLGAFEKILPKYIEMVTFVGEVLPIKQLNRWRRACPNACFVNLYGPTEVTGVCMSYKIMPEHGEFPEDAILPIGKPLRHSEIYLIDNGREICKNDILSMGEICVESQSLSPGYVNNPEKTAEVFVENPICTTGDDNGKIIYKTGDLGRYDSEGNILFVSRKDFQIKHMGYRIELGEIEAVAWEIKKITNVCCVYNEKNNKIVIYFTGNIVKAEIAKYLRDKLPRYMLPEKYVKMDMLPLNGTGKIDRKKLHDMEIEIYE